MDDGEGGEYCLPGYMKERLMRSYESEMEFYQEKIERADNDTDARLIEQWEATVRIAEDNRKTVDDMAVCDANVVDDTNIPAEEPNVDLDPLSADDD